MLLFKTARVESEWASDSPDETLRSLVNWLASQAELAYGKDITITCVYRSHEEDAALYHDPFHQPGVHTYWRGVDISVLNLTSSEIKTLTSDGNYRWTYDPERPWLRCFFFETGGAGTTAPHIHIQTNPETTVPVSPVDSEAGRVL